MIIKDIAKMANVSPTTVSRVINSNYKNHMKQETYKKVLKIIQEVGYSPDALASGLRKGLAKVIGIIIPDNSNPYFASLCKAIEDKCFKEGYGTFFCNSNLDKDRGAYYLKFLSSQKISGLILCNYGLNKEDINIITNNGTNYILLGENIDGVDCDYIGVDDFKGGYMAAEYLYRLGHREILILKGPDNFQASSIRINGFLKFMDEKGNTIEEANIIECNNSTFAEGYNSIAKLAKKKLNFSAIFTFNDLMAIGVIKYLSENKLIQNISVMGFDNIFISELINPSLTTIEDDTKKLGEMAVDRILHKLRDKKIKSKSMLIEPKLIIRDSCKKYIFN